MPRVKDLTPTEFRQRWPEPGSEQVVLLDVREPMELEIAAIDGALHIAMRDVPARLADLERDRAIVVMCHSGVRSRRVADYLLANGFLDVFNLAGGIDAWSRELDPQLARY